MNSIGVYETLVQQSPEPTCEYGGVPIQEIAPELVYHQEDHELGFPLRRRRIGSERISLGDGWPPPTSSEPSFAVAQDATSSRIPREGMGALNARSRVCFTFTLISSPEHHAKKKTWLGNQTSPSLDFISHTERHSIVTEKPR